VAEIVLHEVTKIYSGSVKAVDSLSLDIADGDFLVLHGPPGSGKTTALRMVAGLEEVTGGTIRIGDRVVNDLPPKDRDIAMVFQNYALYRHMTVEDNLAFGLQLRKTPKQEQQRRVVEVAKMLALEPFLKRKPAALSGGQRQRVAMGRAIVREPQAFLMDEPLSNLDAKLRVSMRAQLAALHERLGVTTIYVTHDQIEALTLGTRVALLRDGRLQQVGPPHDLLEHPNNIFVAKFLGSPPMNLVEAMLVRDDGPAVVFGGQRLALSEQLLAQRRGLERYFGKSVVLGIRPSNLRRGARPQDAGLAGINVVPELVEELGQKSNLSFTVAEPGAETPADYPQLWVAQLDPRTDVRLGRPLALAIDEQDLRFFDPDTGAAIDVSDEGVDVVSSEASATASPLRPSEPSKQRRHVNVCLIGMDRTPLPRTVALEPDTSYELRVDIGPVSLESVVVNRERHPFPDEVLPDTKQGHWLEVLAISTDFRVPDGRRDLFLPKEGIAWTCPCQPGGSHACAADARERFLRIQLTTPSRACAAQLRLGVYYEKNLLQSQLLTAQVGDTADANGYGSWIDYTMTSGLVDVHLLAPRQLNILTNENADGTHLVVINGRDNKPSFFNLTEGQVTDAMSAIRSALREIHIDQRGTSKKNRYDKNNAKKPAEFIKDVHRLARLGAHLWSALFQNDLDLAEKVTDGLKGSGCIQISRIRNSTFVFPWSLVYDIALEYPQKEHVECGLLQQWRKDAAAIAALPLDRCPYEHEHGKNIICPFGFWGFRYVIEQPPSPPKSRKLVLQIAHGNPSKLTVGESLELDKALSERHFESLEARLTRCSVSRLQSRAALSGGLADADLKIVYFYCHGLRETFEGMVQPALGIGDQEFIVPDDLMTWARGEWPRGHWKNAGPLVFINGCHTVEFGPDSLVNFVDAFIGVRALGVIGTEIAIHQEVAGEAAAELLVAIQSNTKVGSAIQQMRRRLLRKGNLLGLAYTPYCFADLQLTDTASADRQAVSAGLKGA
jgi:multiple sugar transport system ATP-binding protein